ncbi:hypothetical protein [Accumulibacter sp.]|uniref:hypothetical protein n=1 Tax=Accumulibacter sp. TaxID=2053492 RepID=UPI0025F63EC9|nr:hypothetical protein [Accumulibacter sp.]MCM8625754.1 hypothetical protein [Accumulibacter sp.]
MAAWRPRGSLTAPPERVGQQFVHRLAIEFLYPVPGPFPGELFQDEAAVAGVERTFVGQARFGHSFRFVPLPFDFPQRIAG